jgi:hypothetical protein
MGAAAREAAVVRFGRERVLDLYEAAYADALGAVRPA